MDTLSSINDDMCLILYFTVEKNSNYIVKQMLPDYWSNHHFCAECISKDRSNMVKNCWGKFKVGTNSSDDLLSRNKDFAGD